MVKIKSTVGAVVVLAAVVGGVVAYTKLNTARSKGADDRIALAEFKSKDPAAIARGEYVMRTGDCLACHTSDKGSFAGGYTFDTPFGMILSSNITPDRDSGIGKLTERGFFNAVRHGQGSKGFLYPAMPYTAYSKLTDADLHDLWAYMSTVKPIANAVDENGGLKFPYNVRLAMAGWNMLFYDNHGLEQATGQSAEWERGRYLVDGGTHCSACHSPRNFLGAEVASEYLQGGNLGAWYAPDLTGNPHTGQGAKTVESIGEYLKTGGDGVSLATGPMAEAVEHSFQYLTDTDLHAIGTYIKSLPASPGGGAAPLAAESDAMKRGALRYEVNCSACHGVRGEAMGNMTPAFAGNHAFSPMTPPA